MRRIHKWLMWVIGLQFLFWTLGGVYFSLFDIHYIHGESLLKAPRQLNTSKITYGFAEVLRDFPHADHLKLYAVSDTPYIQFLNKDSEGQVQKQVIDASTGKAAGLLDQSQAEQLAIAAYTGSGSLVHTQLITRDPPFELWQGHLPVWQIRFSDFASPTLYISQTTGEVVTKRHIWWRTFDIFWRLHIMDVLSGEDVKNTLLTVAASLAMVTTIAGLVLSWYLVIVPKLKYKKSSADKIKSRFFRRWHRRISVVVAMQMVIWIATGLYFNLMDSQWYSTHHNKAEQVESQCQPDIVSLQQLTLSEAPVYIELKQNSLGCYLLIHHKNVFHQYQKMQARTFDASTGQELSNLSKPEVLSLAQNSYQGPGEITGLARMASGTSSNSKQQNPVWRVDFDDEVGTSVYIHSVTREVIRHENDNSRFHQLMFTLHFMDYFGTGGFNHWLLKLFAVMALLLTATGIYWLFAGNKRTARS